MQRQRRRFSRWFRGALAPLVVLATAELAAAWEPTKPVEFVVPAGTGGGADQMARLIAGIAEKHKLSPRPLHRRQQVGRGGGGGLPVRQGQEGRRPDHHHHAVQSVHDAAPHRRALQLEGPDAGRAARPRRVHPLGQCRDAVQVGRRVPRCREREERRDEDGWHRVGAGRPDPDHPARAGDGRATPSPSASRSIRSASARVRSRGWWRRRRPRTPPAGRRSCP